MYCFDLHSGTDSVFRIPYIGMSEKEARLQYDSFSEIAAAILKTEPDKVSRLEADR
jgi:hypothetical protein